MKKYVVFDIFFALISINPKIIEMTWREENSFLKAIQNVLKSRQSLFLQLLYNSFDSN
jgi:hypothetical protein